jgi:hypothetical protein
MSDWHLKVTIIPLDRNLYILKETIKVVLGSAWSCGWRLVYSGLFYAVARTGCYSMPQFTVCNVYLILIVHFVSCAVAQAVNHWPLITRAARVQPRVNPGGICARHNGIGTGFSHTTMVVPNYHHSHSHSCSTGAT